MNVILLIYTRSHVKSAGDTINYLRLSMYSGWKVVHSDTNLQCQGHGCTVVSGFGCRLLQGLQCSTCCRSAVGYTDVLSDSTAHTRVWQPGVHAFFRPADANASWFLMLHPGPVFWLPHLSSISPVVLVRCSLWVRRATFSLC